MGESDLSIADDVQVSRERVRQWKNTFGVLTTTYEMSPVVLEALRNNGRGDPDLQ